jgi:lambda family phage minor tail protein L
MSALNEAVQAPSPGSIVTLYQLDAAALGGPTYCFTDGTAGDLAPVFDGVTYTPIPLESEGWEASSKGSFPTPRLRLSNVNRVASAAVIEFNDLLGAKVTRIRTLRQFLDDGDTPDPDALFLVDVYYVERKTAHNKVFIEWELSAAMDQQGTSLPKREILRDGCPFIYRRYDSQAGAFTYEAATCPYTGDAYFTKLGEPTNNPALDRCSKTMSGCRKRFGQNGTLPFGGFPGVGRGF